MSPVSTNIKIDPVLKREAPNAETIKAIEDARNGIGLSRGFTSVSELMEDLDADDEIVDDF